MLSSHAPTSRGRGGRYTCQDDGPYQRRHAACTTGSSTSPTAQRAGASASIARSVATSPRSPRGRTGFGRRRPRARRFAGLGALWRGVLALTGAAWYARRRWARHWSARPQLRSLHLPRLHAMLFSQRENPAGHACGLLNLIVAVYRFLDMMQLTLIKPGKLLE